MPAENTFELTPEWQAVIDCVDVYESLPTKEGSDLRTISAKAPVPYRLAALRELVKVDQEYHWRSGRAKKVAEYLREFPELGLESDPPADLVEFESQLSQRHSGMSTRLEHDPSTRGAKPPAGSTGVGAGDPHLRTMAFDEAASVPGAPASAALHIGRYRVVQELGHGTFGMVYRCHDTQLNRDVAIKMPHAGESASPDATAEFLHEARSAARLRHPGIVTILDTNTAEDGRGYIVFEYIDGSTMQARIAAGGYTREQAVQWISEVAEALHFAHKKGLVHRDIKPANILIDKSGAARLTDFGLAKLDDKFFMDDTGRVLGTVAYMNPEQASGQAHWASPQSDIYSLGVVLYELLCGKRPFNAGSSLDLIQQVEKRPPPPPRTIDDTIPPVLENICLKAMAKNPADRYNTAGDMAKALQAAIAPKRSLNSLMWLAVPAAVLVSLAAVALVKFRPATVVVPSVADAAIDTLQIDVHRPSKHNQPGDFDPVQHLASPMMPDDEIQITGDFNREAYAYAISYEGPNKAKLMFPSLDQLDNQKPVKRISVPRGGTVGGNQKWLRVTADARPKMVLVALAETPLTKAQIEALIADDYQLPARFASGEFAHVVYPSRNRAQEKRGDTRSDQQEPKARGLGDASNVVEGAKNALPERLLDRCRELFSAYEIYGFNDLDGQAAEGHR